MKITNFNTFKKIASAEVLFNVFSCIKSRNNECFIPFTLKAPYAVKVI